MNFELFKTLSSANFLTAQADAHRLATHRRVIALFVLSTNLVLITGCSDDSPQLVRVRGKVTLNGEPLAGKHVQFEPIEGTPGLGGGANTNASGDYDLIAIRGGTTVDLMGIPSGKYKVTVTEPTFPIDLEIQVQGTSSEADVAIGPPTVSPRAKRPRVTIPTRYADVETTPLEIEIPEHVGVVDLRLEEGKSIGGK